MAMAHLSLNLLGGFELAAGDTAVALPTRKAKALVAMLAVDPGRAWPREKLAAMLWEFAGEEQARTSLRQTLSVIRKAFPETSADWLRADGDVLALDAGALAVDVAEFEVLAGGGSAADLEHAAALYRGDLLDGISLREDAFEEWLRTERSRLRDEAVDVLARLVAHYGETGALKAATETAMRLLALDSLREDIHRVVMELHARQGRTDAALRQFQTCREILERELAVELAPETRALYDAILARRYAPGGAEPETEDGASPAGLAVDAPSPVGGASPGSRPLTLPDKPSIAVLPFVNMSGDPKQEFLGDGIAEDVITTLSKIPDLFVISRNSTFTYKGQAVKVQVVARDLGVRYVLEGSVRFSGNRLRLTAQLIDAADGHHIWAERYDREVADIFAVQDDITRNIAIALQGRLVWGFEPARWQGGTHTFQAWECQMRGMHLFARFTREGHAEARMLFEKAVEIDPDYLMAWVMLGACHGGNVFYGWSSDTAMSLRKAEEFFERALSGDASLAQGHAFLADLFLIRRDHDKAIAAAEHAVDLAPSGSDEHAILAMILVYADRPAEALKYIKRAIRLDPHYPAYFAHALIHGHRLTGELENAREMALDILHRYPDYWLGRAGLAAVCAKLGLDQEAYAAAQEVLRCDPEFSIAAHSGRAPFKDPRQLDEYLAALRKAGLPE